MSRLTVPKTYKLFIGGAFPRSESGRTFEIVSANGDFLANAAQASRKDARDAVKAARAAASGWSGATAYNRGQVLYRIADCSRGGAVSLSTRSSAERMFRARVPRNRLTKPSIAGCGTPGGQINTLRCQAMRTRCLDRSSISRFLSPQESSL